MSVLPHVRQGIYGELQVASARGAEIIDQSGRTILDLTSGFGVAALGHSYPPIVEAVARQMRCLGHAMASLVGYEGQERAAELIAERTLGSNSAVVLTTSGAEAVEVARKVAYLATARPGIVVLSGAYHGQSLGTLELTGQRSLRSPFDGLVFRSPLVLPTPGQRRAVDSDRLWSDQDCLALLAFWLESGAAGSPNVGAVLVEPMQNLAGYRFFGKPFGEEVSRLCRKHGVLLIADEIFTGFGRTGRWSLSAEAGYAADLMCVGKALTGGIPGGACVGPGAMVRLLFPAGGPSLHAPTFYYSPVVSAAMEAAITSLSSLDLLPRASRIGASLLARLGRHENSAVVSCVRGMGGAVAIEFRNPDSGRRRASEVVLDVAERLLARGVLALNSGFPEGNVLSICPPLIISDAQLTCALDALDACIDEVGRQG